MTTRASAATSAGVLLGVPVAFAALSAVLLLTPSGVLVLLATAVLLAAAALAELRRGNPLALPAPRPGQAE